MTRSVGRRYESWGRYPPGEPPARVVSLYSRSDVPPLCGLPEPLLAFGEGRSYGDSCQNGGGTLLDARPLSRFIEFDRDRGVLRCEAGVTFHEILELALPHGWFLPVTPGTRFVTVGGAMANDVHGKNHHAAGTFGRHVHAFELLRSDGARLVCTPDHNAELFAATIGGLGLTGLILWAEFGLREVAGPWIEQERVAVRDLDHFVELSEESDERFEHTVAWLDGMASGSRLGRGIFIRGNHAPSPDGRARGGGGRGPRLRVPFEAPSWLLNRWTIRAFNTLYRTTQARPSKNGLSRLDSFFYPLDGIGAWNRLYGARGFVQYQCVVPEPEAREPLREVLARVGRSGDASFLSVLKRFGGLRSPGLLSFPRPGLTVALDFPFRGERTLALLDSLDEVVRDAQGAVYPAKDARMSAATFRAGFPRWREFAEHVDPAFSSDFWRRVTGDEESGP